MRKVEFAACNLEKVSLLLTNHLSKETYETSVMFLTDGFVLQ